MTDRQNDHKWKVDGIENNSREKIRAKTTKRGKDDETVDEKEEEKVGDGLESRAAKTFLPPGGVHGYQIMTH